MEVGSEPRQLAGTHGKSLVPGRAKEVGHELPTRAWLMWGTLSL